MTNRNSVLLVLPLALSLLGGCDKQRLDMMSAFDPSGGGEAGELGERSTAKLYLTIVEGLIDQGRYRAALGYLDQYAVSQTKTPRYSMLRGEALLGVGRYDEAAAEFGALKDSEFKAAGANGLGRVAAVQNRWPEAEGHFAEAVAARPSNADYLNNLGFAELHLGDGMLPKAEFNLRQALEIDPNSASIRTNLILALTMEGKEEDASTVLDGIAVPRQRAEVQKFANDWVEAQRKPKADQSGGKGHEG